MVFCGQLGSILPKPWCGKFMAGKGLRARTRWTNTQFCHDSFSMYLLTVVAVPPCVGILQPLCSAGDYFSLFFS